MSKQDSPFKATLSELKAQAKILLAKFEELRGFL
jgi:hypothetical protein